MTLAKYKYQYQRQSVFIRRVYILVFYANWKLLVRSCGRLIIHDYRNNGGVYVFPGYIANVNWKFWIKMTQDHLMMRNFSRINKSTSCLMYVSPVLVKCTATIFSIIGDWAAHIHIFMFTDCKSNWFQKKLMMQNANMWIFTPSPTYQSSLAPVSGVVRSFSGSRLILTHPVDWNLNCNDFPHQDLFGYFPLTQSVLDDKYNVDRLAVAVIVQ